jgi:hypothetical protein
MRTLPRTHASPAIDAGSDDDSLLHDQRNAGFPRIFGAAADIGAFEVQASVGDEIFANGFDGTTVD